MHQWRVRYLLMARLQYELSGDNTGLINATNQAIANINKLTESVNKANGGLQFSNGIAALDNLGKALLVVNGNATLFGDSFKNQTAALSAYQTALNSLLANGFDPLDGDVQKVKGHIDELTASLKAANAVPARTTVNDTNSSPSAENLARPNFVGSTEAPSASLAALNEQLANGTLSAEQYNAALAGANSTINKLAEGAQNVAFAFENELGLIPGLKAALSDLQQAQGAVLPGEQAIPQLEALNAEIQATEAEIKRFQNIGKVGFDEFGNSIKGVNLSNINGQLVALTNNLFGARQIARDTIKAFDSTSLSSTIKSVSLLATDFLFYAQSAQFATGTTVAATGAIATEGVVSAGAAVGVSTLGAALGSLLNPAFLVVLGIGLLGEAFEKQDKDQKDAEKSAKDYTEAQKKLEAEVNGQSGFVKSAADLTTLSEKISLAKQGFLDKSAVLKEYNSTLGETIGRVNNLNDAEQKIVDNGPSYLQFLILKAQAQNAITKAANDSYNAAVTQNKINTPAFSTDAKQQKLNVALAPVSKTLLTNQLTQDNAAIKASSQVAQDAITKLEDFAKAHNFQIYSEKSAKSDSDNFNNLQQQLDALLQKNSQLAGDTSGLTGYPKKVADITKSYEDLNTQVEKYIINVKNAVANGSITPTKGNSFINQANTVISQLPSEQDKAVNDAKIQDAKDTADAITKINNDFGIKQQFGYNQDLTRTKALYDSIVQANIDKANSLAQIDANYQASITAAGGNKLALDAAKLVYNAQIQQAKDATAKIAAANADLLPAIQAIDAKYIQQEQETYDKIIDIANQAFSVLDDGEASRTDKINTEWQKRLADANKYFDQLRTLAIDANLPQSAIANINSVQSQVNNVIDAAKFKAVSEEISKNFADAMQTAVQGFVSDFYTSLTGLGAARQAIDAKYADQLASAQDQATRDQIERIKQLEQQTTTSFGAIFSDLVSKFSASFNQSILQSITKQFTENLGKTLIAPTAKQLTISPEEQSAENVATLLKNAGANLAQQIIQAGEKFAASIPHTGSIVPPSLLSGASGGSSLGQVSELPGGLDNFSLVGDTFGSTVANSGQAFHSAITDGSASLVTAGDTTGKSLTTAGDGVSKGLAEGAVALSLAGSVLSGIVSPTSSIGQGAAGALSLAGEGATIGAAFGPEGAVIGAIGGGIIGAISGLFGASKAQKALQQQQLEEAQQQTALLKASLAYTSSIIGRDTTNGIVTGVTVGATGQLTATVSGKDLQFVLDRNANGR